MKAPDKVYVSIGYEAQTKPFRTGVEYIRKDALLELAEETCLNENASAIRKVCYKQLIDKLNSL